MPNNFPSPLAILGVPSPREVFDEFVNLKQRIDKLEKELASHKKEIERQNKKIDRLKTDLKRVIKQQLKTTRKKKRQPSSPIKDNKLARKLRESKEQKKTYVRT